LDRLIANDLDDRVLLVLCLTLVLPHVCIARVLHFVFYVSFPDLRYYISESRSTDGTSFSNRSINEVEK